MLALADRTHAAAILREPVVLRMRPGGGNPSVQALAPVGPLPHDAKCTICLDLTVEPSFYASLDDAGIQRLLGEFPRWIKLIRSNAFEILVADDGLFDAGRFRERVVDHNDNDPSVAKVAAPSSDLLASRSDQIRGDAALCARIVAAVTKARRPAGLSPLAEEQLYNGHFPSNGEYLFGRNFLNQAPAGRTALIADMFVDTRLKEFARRIAWLDSPGSFSGTARADFDAWVIQRVTGPLDAPWRTVSAARAELATLIDQADPGQLPRLAEIGGYLDGIETSVRKRASRP